jgi:hypothetical protein
MPQDRKIHNPATHVRYFASEESNCDVFRQLSRAANCCMINDCNPWCGLSCLIMDYVCGPFDMEESNKIITQFCLTAFSIKNFERHANICSLVVFETVAKTKGM